VLQQVHVSSALRTLHLDGVLQVRPLQYRAEGQDHLPSPADHASFDADQDMVGFLGWESTLLAHVQLAIHQYLQVFWDRPMLSLFIPQHVLVVGGFSCPTCRTLHLDFLILMRFTCACCMSLSRSLCLASCPSGVSPHSLVLSANFLRVHSTPLMMSLMKILKSISLSMDPCGTTLIINCHPGVEPLTAALWTQSCSQFFVHSTVHPSKPYFSSFLKQLPKTQSN